MRRTGLVSFRFAILTSLGLVHACTTESNPVGDNEEQLDTSNSSSATDTSNTATGANDPSGPSGTVPNDDDDTTEPNGGGGTSGDDDVQDPGPVGTPPVLIPVIPSGDDDTSDDDGADDDTATGDDTPADDDTPAADDATSDDDTAAGDDATSDDDTAAGDDTSDDDTTAGDDTTSDDDTAAGDDTTADDTTADDTTGDDATDDDVTNDDTAGDDASGDDAADDVPPDPACQASEELCATVEHRPAPVTCASELPRARVLEAPSSEYFSCLQDMDCTEQPHGRCELWDERVNQIGMPGSSCSYGCVTDDECGEGQVCQCASPVGQCVRAHDCEIDAACPAGSLCARYAYFDGCFDTIGFACTSADDQCLTNADCSGDMQCGYEESQKGRRCIGAICAVGRPFLIDGQARVACVEFRSDWLSPSALDASTLNTVERQRLSQEWQRVGQMEHASIAAFARFALQLLALGAPPELIEATSRAMRDETRHTELAFGLASRYAGRSMGPGPLSLDGALDETLGGADWESIVHGTVLEGCIGETVAALEAKEAAAHVTDPELRAVLLQIAADEARHAELAWQFVKWAIAQKDTARRPELASGVEQRVKAELQKADANARLTASSVDDAESRWLLVHGVFSEARRAELRASVLRSVVVPCVEALLATEARELANAA